MADNSKTKRENSQQRELKSGRKIPPIAVAGIGDDSNWNVADTAFDELARHCGIELDTESRDLVRWFLMSHVTIANQKALAPKAKEIVKLLDKMTKHAHSLRDVLADLKSGGKPDVQHAWSALAQAGFSDTSSHRLQAELASLLTFIPSARELLADRASIPITTGRQPRPHLQDLIWQVAFIFERAGGAVSANYSPNARMPDKKIGGRKSPFTEFVFGIMASLPASMQEDYGALAEVIHRALEARPNGWTPPNLEMIGQNSK